MSGPPGPENPHYPAIPFPAPVKRNNARVRSAGLVAAGIVAAILLLLIIISAGVEVGLVNLALGVAFALLPVPVYLGAALWLDRFEPEPRWMILSTFMWGAAVATFIAIVLNTIGQIIVTENIDAASGEIFAGSISAPVVEEITKGAVLFIVYFAKRDEFNGVVDGIVYATIVGLGFATTENVLYYGRGALESGFEGGLLIFVLRGILTPFLHPLFTALTGLGLGIATTSHKQWVRIVAPTAGLIGAIVLHSAWNTSALGGSLVILVYLLVMLPAFLAMVVILVLGLRREGQLVRTYLAGDVQRGLLNPWELDQLSSVGARISTAWRAWRTGGWKEWRNRRAYHATASELAFLRFRVAKGLQRGDPQPEERRYLERLAMLRAAPTQ